MSLRPRRSEKFYIGFNVIGDDGGADERNLVFNGEREARRVEKATSTWEKRRTTVVGRSQRAFTAFRLALFGVSSIRCTILPV